MTMVLLQFITLHTLVVTLSSSLLYYVTHTQMKGIIAGMGPIENRYIMFVVQYQVQSSPEIHFFLSSGVTYHQYLLLLLHWNVTKALHCYHPRRIRNREATALGRVLLACNYISSIGFIILSVGQIKTKVLSSCFCALERTCWFCCTTDYVSTPISTVALGSGYVLPLHPP